MKDLPNDSNDFAESGVNETKDGDNQPDDFDDELKR